MRDDPQEDFRVLFEAGYKRVFAAARVLAGSAELAHDAAQEAFAKAFARWSRLQRQPWALAWIMRTALNEVRGAKRTILVEERDAAYHDPDTAAVVDVLQAIRTLSRRQQEAIVLYHLADLSISDSAAAMGCSEGAVKAHLARARASLASRLEDVS